MTTEGDVTAQGRVTGLILPPPDIRAVVDKTAQFVARNGRSFERKIAGETASAKFAFLRPADPYHAYYEHKLRELAAPQPDEPETATAAASEQQPQQEELQAAQPRPASDEPQSQPPQEQPDLAESASSSTVVVEKKAVEAATAKAVKKLKEEQQQAELEAPADEQFKLKHPTALSALDQEIMYLTAQYTALSGTSFLAGLATREQRNPQFDFLKPTHALFAYFTALVDSYVKVMTQSAESDRLVRLVDGMDRMHVLDRCVHRLEYARTEQERRDREAAESDAERLALAQIDWHDFVVVETITLDDAEEEAAAQAQALAQAQAQADNGSDDDDMDMDEDSETDEHDNEPKPAIRVVENYVPLATAPTGPATAQLLTVDGKAVSSAEANEHMRILLLNPKWREETQRHLEKQKESSFAAGTAIADSLRRFATKRADIFASSAEEEARLVQATATPVPSATLPPTAQQLQQQQEDDDKNNNMDDSDSDSDDKPPSTVGATVAPPPAAHGVYGQPPPVPIRPGFLGPPGYPGAPPGVAPGTLPPGVRPPPMMGPPGAVRPPGMMMMGPPGMPLGPPGVPPGLPPSFNGSGPPGALPPMVGGTGVLPGAGPPADDAEPAAKRQRTDTTLLPEAEFAALHPVRPALLPLANNC